MYTAVALCKLLFLHLRSGCRSHSMPSLDTGGHTQPFWLKLVREMNLKRNVQFSVFMLDYELAPEFQYPSQIIETSVAWSWLVNNQGIDPKRICVSGDSAGGNIITGFLLNMARPHPNIVIPEIYGKLPERPHVRVAHVPPKPDDDANRKQHVMLMSPFINLCARTKSRDDNAAYDVIEQGSAWVAALAYVGERVPDSQDFVPSWNPVYQLIPPVAPPGHGLGKRTKHYTAYQEHSGLALLDSPYVNPSVNHNLEWWKEALPGDGRTMVLWGPSNIPVLL